MPIEQGYESRVMPRGAPGPALTSPDSYGAGFGAAIANAGEMIQRAQADQQATAATLALTKARAAMIGDIEHLRTDGAQPGGAGHVDAVQSAWEQRTQGVLDGVTDPHVARAVQAQIAAQGAEIADREMVWQAGQQVAHTVLQQQEASALSYNIVANDPSRLPQEMQARRAAIAALQGLPPDRKEEMAHQSDVALTTAHLLGGDPVTGLATLRQGVFNYLPEESRQHIEAELGIRIRQEQAQVRQAQAAQMAGAKEVIATAQQQIENGEPIDRQTVETARAVVASGGDTSTAEHAAGLIAQDKFARQYQGQLPNQMMRRMAELTGNANPTKNDQLELQFLRKAAPARQEAFSADSKGYFAQYGGPDTAPPPLDLSNRQSVDATVAWVRKMSSVAGQQVNVLMKGEAATLAQQARSGVQGRVAVLSALDALPDHERFVAAQQIMPGDAEFRQESQIAPEVRSIVFNGREWLKAHPAFFKPDPKVPGAQDKLALLGTLGQELRTALYALPVDDQNAVQRNAGEWLAGRLSSQNRDAMALTPWDIRQAATFALGGHYKHGRQYGGIDHWHDDHVFVLPDSMSTVDFVNNVDRDRQRKEREGRGPSMDLQLAYPILINGTPGGAQYRWQTAAGRIVKDAKGHDYISDVEAGQ